MSQGDKEIQPIEHSPAPLPQNAVIAKADAIDVQKLAELQERGLSVTFIDLEVFQVQETQALEARQQSHEHRLEMMRLNAQLEERAYAERHKRRMQIFRFAGEVFLKGTVFAGGFYLTIHGDQYSGNLMMGAVASTFAKGFIEKLWKGNP